MTDTRDEPSAEALELFKHIAGGCIPDACEPPYINSCGCMHAIQTALDAYAKAAVEEALGRRGNAEAELKTAMILIQSHEGARERWERERDELRAQLAEAQQKLSWIDEVPRAQHPDDERPWAAEMIRAKSALAEAQKDTARLNWLNEQMYVQPNESADPYYVIELPTHDCPDPKDANIREATDAAMGDAEDE